MVLVVWKRWGWGVVGVAGQGLMLDGGVGVVYPVR